MDIFFIYVGVLFALFVIYLLIINNNLVVKREKIASARLPKGFDGYKIIFISDLHDCSLSGISKNRLLKKVKKTSPDVIFLGGDMHEKKGRDKKYFSLLSALSEIAPLYFVEGNHERKLRKRADFASYLSEFQGYLTNLSGKCSLYSKGDEIKLYGCGYAEFKPDIFSFGEDFSILLYHSPFAFDELPTLPDLMISGHVHGGIFELPFVGAVFSPADGRPFFQRFRREFFFPKYYKGMYKKENSTLLVSRGVGNFKYCPVRFLFPEITEITLESLKNL